MADLVQAVEIECPCEIWAECPKCQEQVNVIEALGSEEKAFAELLRGFPSPTPHTLKVVGDFEFTCSHCGYSMRGVAFNFEQGW